MDLMHFYVLQSGHQGRAGNAGGGMVSVSNAL